MVGDGDEDRAVVADVHARRLQRLVKRAGELVVVADGLARGFHLRRENRNYMPRMLATKVALTYQHFFSLPYSVTPSSQRLAQNHLRGDMGHRNARRFGGTAPCATARD